MKMEERLLEKIIRKILLIMGTVVFGIMVADATKTYLVVSL